MKAEVDKLDYHVELTGLLKLYNSSWVVQAVGSCPWFWESELHPLDDEAAELIAACRAANAMQDAA